MFSWLVWHADRGTMPNWMQILVTIPGMDKLGHFLVTGTLAWCVNLSLSWRRLRMLSQELLVGSLLVMAVVTLEEFSQIFLATRSFDWLDLTADTFGILLAGILSPPQTGSISTVDE